MDPTWRVEGRGIVVPEGPASSWNYRGQVQPLSGGAARSQAG